MKSKILIVSYLLFIHVLYTAKAQSPVLEPFTYSFDFESGSVGSWSSYPPAQDIAYDPTIWVKKIPDFSKNLSLVREITPNYQIEYIFGVRKKVDIYVDQSSSLLFNYYVKNRFSAESIRVKFGFEDGTNIEENIQYNHQLTGAKCEIKFSELIPKGEIKHLRGIAFLVVCPKADPEALLRFAIDDVKISGKRAKNWVVESPEVYKLDEWKDFISARHFKEGDKLFFSGKIPFTAKSAKVSLSRALTGENSKTYSMVQNGTRQWKVNLPLNSAGFWRATFSASDNKGNSISTSLVYLVKPGSAPKGHPRLFISPGDEQKILDKTTSGHLGKVWQNFLKETKTKRNNYNVDDFNYNLDVFDETYWLPTYSGYVTAIRAPAGYVRDNAIEYALTQHPEAGEAARLGLLKMAEWPSYVHPHILNQGQFTYWPVGLVLIDLALGYDFVYNKLSSSERNKIAETLYNKGVIPIFKEYVRDNRVSGNTSNWISHVTGGGILSAVAIMNEYPDRALEPYLTGMILKLGKFINKTFGRDGAYGEGYSYHNFTMQTLSEIMSVLGRNFGIRFPKKIASSYLYLIYQMNRASGNILDFGDTSDKLIPMSNFAYLIGKYRDPYLKWLYDLSPGNSDKDLFFLDETVIAKNPENLPLVKHFRDVGTVVFRSGFTNDDFIFVFRCGPFFNHQHFDQGSFFLSDLGQEFITEAGRTNYYNDPWYQKLFIQAGAHSTILANDNPESQRAGDLLNDVEAWNDYAQITDFFEFEAGAFVSGDLTKIYKGKFKKLSRNILYIKPKTIVLIDRGIGANGENRMNLRFHAPMKNNISIEGNTARIKRGESTLFINTIFPDNYTQEVLKRPLTLDEFNKENIITMTARGFLQLSSDSNSFVNILTTTKDVISNLDTKSSTGYVQFTIDKHIYYINNQDEKFFNIGEIKTDALVYSSRGKSFIALKVKNISKGSKNIFTANSPVSISMKHGNESTIKYSAPQNTEISFYTNTKPQKIELNGKLETSWKYDNLSIELNIPKGDGNIQIFE